MSIKHQHDSVSLVWYAVIQCLRRNVDFSLIFYRLEKKLVDIREEKLALEKQENEQKKRRAEKVNVFDASFDAFFRIRFFSF